MVRVKTTSLRSRAVIKKKEGDSSPTVRSFRLTKQINGIYMVAKPPCSI